MTASSTVPSPALYLGGESPEHPQRLRYIGVALGLEGDLEAAHVLGEGRHDGHPLALHLGQLVGALLLAYGRAVGVESALPKGEAALLVSEAVGGDAELGVLDADVEAGRRHLADVAGVLGAELGIGLEETVELGGDGIGGAVEGVGGGEGEGDHGDGPAADAEGGGRGALLVEEGDEARGHVPVAAQVEVLDGVHGGVLEGGDVEARGEEVEADEGPVELLAEGGGVGALAGVGGLGAGDVDDVVEVLAEGSLAVDPGDEELEHGGRVPGEVHDGGVVHDLELLLEVGRRGAELGPVHGELAVLPPDVDADDFSVSISKRRFASVSQMTLCVFASCLEGPRKRKNRKITYTSRRGSERTNLFFKDAVEALRVRDLVMAMVESGGFFFVLFLVVFPFTLLALYPRYRLAPEPKQETC